MFAKDSRFLADSCRLIYVSIEIHSNLNGNVKKNKNNSTHSNNPQTKISSSLITIIID